MPAIGITDQYTSWGRLLQAAACIALAAGYGLLVYAGVALYLDWLQYADAVPPGAGRVLAFLGMIPAALLLTCWLARGLTQAAARWGWLSAAWLATDRTGLPGRFSSSRGFIPCGTCDAAPGYPVEGVDWRADPFTPRSRQ